MMTRRACARLMDTLKRLGLLRKPRWCRRSKFTILGVDRTYRTQDKMEVAIETIVMVTYGNSPWR